MSYNPNDDFKYQSILDIAMQIMNGLDIIKANKKKGMKIIGGFLPPMDNCLCRCEVRKPEFCNTGPFL